MRLAEATLAHARREAVRAETAAAKAAARREAFERDKQQLEERLAGAIKDEHAATAEVKKTARSLTDAERALARARNEK